MANFLTLIALTDGKPVATSLEALGQARRVATEVGATLYALVLMSRAPSGAEEGLFATLSEHGADKVMVAVDARIGDANTTRWTTHGPAMATVCEQVPPTVLLVPMEARELAARMATRLSAAYVHEGFIEAVSDGLRVWEENAKHERVGLEGALEVPVVITLPSGRYQTERGDDEAEVEIVQVQS